jgi:hypothetical protein
MATDDRVTQLLRDAPLSFIGTVEHLGASTMAELPIDERTAVIDVVQVLHAPEAFSHLAGHRVTMQLAADADPPQVGETAVFFAQGLAFGETLAVSEIGRAAVSDIEPHITSAAQAGAPGAFAPQLEALETERLQQHAQEADAIVVGRVTGLQDVLGPPRGEHSPNWWKATIQVEHAEKGDIEPGALDVLYPNSLDVRWARVPKPKASQDGMWFLHATEGDLRETAPFQILHPEDFQPEQTLERIRGQGG